MNNKSLLLLGCLSKLVEDGSCSFVFVSNYMCAVQVRICTRMGVEMKSTDFKSKDYYSNIRKAVTAGYFMQVCDLAC